MTYDYDTKGNPYFSEMRIIGPTSKDEAIGAASFFLREGSADDFIFKTYTYGYKKSQRHDNEIGLSKIAEHVFAEQFESEARKAGPERKGAL